MAASVACSPCCWAQAPLIQWHRQTAALQNESMISKFLLQSMCHRVSLLLSKLSSCPLCQDFPFHSDVRDLARYDPRIAHFLALCAKVMLVAAP
jgi:hypothetical protein